MKPLFSVLLVLFTALSICTDPLNADPTPKPKQKATVESQLPFGIPVPGKPNLVYSPYAKGKIIDVAPPTVAASPVRLLGITSTGKLTIADIRTRTSSVVPWAAIKGKRQR